MTMLKRAFLIITIISVFGGGSLLLGIHVGYTFGNHRLVQTPAVQHIPAHTPEDEPMTFTFADQYVQALPLEIRTSDITSVVQSVSGSVVSISIDVPASSFFGSTVYNPGSGSGIIFAQDEVFLYIATNNHVVYRASRIGVSFDDEEEIDAILIDGNWYADLAVISVPLAKVGGKEFSIASFGDSDNMRVGDEVVAIGNPMGGGQTATRGIVSATGRQITVDGRTLNVLQTDAAINPGNSGGALANINGEIIGINTAKAVSSHIEGMGYAIPSNQALEILQQLLEDGTTPRPYIGIGDTFTITENFRRMYALPSVGIMIMSVHPYSPAEEAGLKEFDLIVGFNQMPVETNEDLIYALGRVSVGDNVTLQIYRNGMFPMEVGVVIGDANERE